MILKHYCCIFAMKRAALKGTEARQEHFYLEIRSSDSPRLREKIRLRVFSHPPCP
jgi:hypothetical protein